VPCVVCSREQLSFQVCLESADRSELFSFTWTTQDYLKNCHCIGLSIRVCIAYTQNMFQIANIQRVFYTATSVSVMKMTYVVPNRVLGASPPDISPLESLLPRSVRTTLAQLRSGHCWFLISYKARVTSGISDVCPECGVAPHSVEHLFNCQSHPMQLTVHVGQPGCGRRLPQPGQLTIGEELLGYHNNNNKRRRAGNKPVYWLQSSSMFRCHRRTSWSISWATCTVLGHANSHHNWNCTPTHIHTSLISETDHSWFLKILVKPKWGQK